MAGVCSRCNVKLSMWAMPNTFPNREGDFCDKCFNELKTKFKAEITKIHEDEEHRLTELKQLSQKVIITTTPGVDGYKVAEYLGIESVEFVIGTGVFSEVSSSIADFFGARSSAFERKLQVAKQHSMEALKFLAAEKGANAVVAVDLDYTEFSGNRIVLIINGTLVRIEPIDVA